MEILLNRLQSKVVKNAAEFASEIGTIRGGGAAPSSPENGAANGHAAPPSPENAIVNGGALEDSADARRRKPDPSAPSPPQTSSSSAFPSCFLHLRSEGGHGDEWRWLRRCAEASAKGFAIGAGLKGGLALFSILTRLRSRRSLRSSARGSDHGDQRDDAIWNVSGAFAGTFVSVDECIAAIWGHKRTAGWRALLAGALAGPSMILTGPNTQHTSLAIYILMRAAVLASRCGIKSKKFGHLCKPLTWSHGDIFLMCLSSSQILSAYILKQDSLPLSYKSFLNKHGGKILLFSRV
uniref:Uncharacterized protein n=1 Tax=Ananas comosus var. bracteatus TaxID=296719 RepID=A0A6V7QWT8_ANACO